MRDQQGAITLLITALLLVAILVLSLASYKNVFFQAKRAQNEIIARQNHWAAEGGLECAYSLAVLDPEHIGSRTGTLPIGSSRLEYSECGSGLPVIAELPITGQNQLTTVLSTQGNSYVQKVLKIPRAQGQAAITANADLMLYGSYTIRPNPNTLSSSGEYECLSVRYSQTFKYKNDGGLIAYPPYDTQYDPIQPSNTLTCEPTFVTNLNVDSFLDQENDQASESIFKSDYVFDSHLSPFNNLFGIDVTKKDEVKKGFTVVSGSGDCDSDITSALDSGSSLIWIEGNCDMATATQIASRDTSDGIIVVVENGLLSITGAVPFSGVLYQLINNHSYHPSSHDWVGMSGEVWVNAAKSTGIIAKIPTAYIVGSAIPDGTIILDTPGNLAVIHGSAAIAYNKSKIDHPLKKLLKPKWLKGSWHDF